MEPTFKLEIITPYRVFYQALADMLLIHTADGEFGILANHEPTVASVAIGEVKIRLDGVWKNAFVSDGFLEIEGNRVTVLVGAAEWPEEIDVSRAQRSLYRANERLKANPLPMEVHRSSQAVKRAKTRLNLVEKIQQP